MLENTCEKFIKFENYMIKKVIIFYVIVYSSFLKNPI